MKKQCIRDLFAIGAIQFGSFQLKSGITSPLYIDLRLLVSYPKLLGSISDLLWEKVSHCQFNCLVGVPYTALPLATALSLKHEVPMVMRRKEAKDHGTKKIIEGAFQPGWKCLVIEDLITSGMSIFETIEPVEAVSLKVEDVVVLLDRQQGGRKRLEQKGYRLHAVLTISELLETLLEENKITEATFNAADQFLKEQQFA